LKEMGKSKRYIEIHHAVLENNLYLNSNWIGSLEYCEMQTFLRVYVNSISDPNQNQLWGNIIHDYLSFIFSNSIIQPGITLKQLEMEILAAFEKACYQNWINFVTLGKSVQSIIKEFKSNFLANEMEFILNEMEFYKKEYGDFSFICEKMVYSQYLGLQGRIDRLVHDIPFTKFRIYETKTGTSPKSSQQVAFYQAMSYALIILEQKRAELEKIVIEYPRLPLSERLKLFNYSESDLIQVIAKRNEIWTILCGNQPERNHMLPCGHCSSRSACDFYEFRKNFTSKLNNLTENRFDKYFMQDGLHQALFKRLDAYITWFFHLLDLDFSQNVSIINDLHLPAKNREQQGNCIADLILIPINDSAFYSDRKQKIIQILQLQRKAGNLQKNTRLRKGDYILLTPQKFIPLTSESKYGIIKKFTNSNIVIELRQFLDKNDDFLNHSPYRVDLTSSTYGITLQKRSIDMLMRFSCENDYPNITVLRNLLLFTSNPRMGKVKESLLDFSDQSFDESQKKAISIALKSQDLTLIQGPPGSGKTSIIIEIIHRLLLKIKSNTRNDNVPIKKTRFLALDKFFDEKKRFIPSICPILISSFTNKALDNIISKLIKRYPKIRIVRIGKISKTDDKDILSHCIEYICRDSICYSNGTEESIIDPQRVRLVLDKADVIAATTTTAGSMLLHYYQFDTVILDEAGQIQEGSALVPLLKGKHFILVGDHQQLPPVGNPNIDAIPLSTEIFMDILHFSKEKGLNLSIFERLVSEYNQSSNYVMLSYQYRMNRIISDFISQEFYDGLLQPGKTLEFDVSNQNLMEFLKQNNVSIDGMESGTEGPYFDHSLPMVFLDTKQLDSLDSSAIEETKDLESLYNATESEIVVRLICHIVSNCLKSKLPPRQILEFLLKIGIISGYRAQNQQIMNNISQNIREIILNEEYSKKWKENEIQSIIDSIIVDTVDRFQGQERELIIYSFIDSNHFNELHQLNLETRRLNVAISRTKKKIIFIGNSNTLTQSGPKDNPKSISVKSLLARLIEYIRNYDGYFELNK
ncbi:MAG: AAA domain-containing protein, partial [Promethearchaeota archaeon]